MPTDRCANGRLACSSGFVSGQTVQLALPGNHLRHWLTRAKSTRQARNLDSCDDMMPLEVFEARYVAEVVKLLEGDVTESARRLKLHRHSVAALSEYEGAARKSPEGK